MSFMLSFKPEWSLKDLLRDTKEKNKKKEGKNS